MRLGKSLVCIRRVRQYSGRTLVLLAAPYSALAGWEEELTAEGVHFTRLIGSTGKARRKQLDGAINLAAETRARQWWVLVNKEIHRTIPDIYNLPWDVVIIDESICIKNPQAKITQFFLRNFRRARYRWILNGTPAPENNLEYYCQLKFLSDEIMPEKTFWDFRAKWFEPRGFEWVLTDAGRAEMTRRLSRYTFIMKRADANLGGTKIYERYAVEMPAELRRIYRTVEEEFLMEIQGEEVDASIWATQRYIWMRQLCSGFIGGELKYSFKVEALVDLVDTHFRKQQFIVWCQYRMELEAVSEALEEYGIENEIINGSVSPAVREQYVKDFQAGKVQCLVIQPETMKFGARLTAADTMIYFSTPESGLTRGQTEDRTIDIMDPAGALIVDLSVEDTIEEDILLELLKKTARSESLTSLVRSIQRRKSIFKNIGK